MGDSADVYESTRRSITELVTSLSDAELNRPVPATPAWTIKDVVCHLTGDVECLIRGDFPRAFFEAFGSPEGIVSLNEWTDSQVKARRDRDLQDVLLEWEKVSGTLVAMARGEEPWPEDVPFFTDRVMITDAGVHQQDIYGALGIVADRDSAPVRMGFAGYIATLGWRFASDGIAPLRFELEDKSYTAGEGEAESVVSGSRFEFFRALSGRRNQDQVRAFDWTGDAEPYLPYFFPYGLRPDALVE